MYEVSSVPAKQKKRHCCDDLILLFQRCFEAEYHTQLVRGGEEPLYQPKNASHALHTIYFAHGFFSSALHECSHWFIAGDARRQLVDFGYWYEPDGRTAEQQVLFQKVEVKPQAIEWILSMAADYRFQFSLDNLNGAPFQADAFKEAVYQQVLTYCEYGLPARVERFRQALSCFYGTPALLNKPNRDF